MKGCRLCAAFILPLLTAHRRRTMKDKILGRHIVELPPIYPVSMEKSNALTLMFTKILKETQYISFSREEKVLYRILEDRFRENINREFRRGTAKNSYHYFLVFLLRLRQCTARQCQILNRKMIGN
jgi:hypothetical protein